MEPLSESFDNMQAENTPLTKPKKILSAKQIESMRAGREILKQKREEAKARKVLEANEILSKYSKSIPEPEKEQKEIKLEPVKIQIDEPKPKKAKAIPLKIPEVESDSDSEPEQQIVMIKKKKKAKKPKSPKIIYKYISESDSSDSDAQPPAKKQLQKPARAEVNKKQIRAPAPSIFCD